MIHTNYKKPTAQAKKGPTFKYDTSPRYSIFRAGDEFRVNDKYELDTVKLFKSREAAEFYIRYMA